MNALILANGELYKPEILRHRIHDVVFDLVLGADGGACHSETLSVALDAILGDLDSTREQLRPLDPSIKIVAFPEEKDEIDLELALLYAASRGSSRIVMVGVMGGRMDMTIANLLLMNRPALAACRIEAWHGDQTGWLIKPPGQNFEGAEGDTISLIPLGGDASGVTTYGMKYPLRQERLSLGQTRGLSNVIDCRSAGVGFSEGLLLAVHTPGRA